MTQFPQWRFVPPLWAKAGIFLAGGAALACTTTAHAQQSDDFTAMSLEQLLQVSITGASKYEQSQGSVAAAASVITRQEIKAFGWRSLDEALSTLPGLHITYDRQIRQLGTRGFGLPGDFTTRVLVLINGNRVNEPTYDSGLVGRNLPIDMDLVERIEFIPGPGGAVYGRNAMLGVVNVITRQGSDLDGAELALVYQPLQRQREARASWGTRTRSDIDLLLSMSALDAKGEDRFYDFGPAGVAGVATGLDGERSRQIFARIARGAWSLEHTFGTHRKNDPTGTYFSDPLRSGQHVNADLALTQLKYEESFADESLHVSARLFHGALRYRTQLYYSGDSSASATRSDWAGAELRLVSTAIAGHTLMVGVEGQDDYRSNLTIPIPVVPSYSILLRNPGYRAGVFAQDEWRFVPNMAATLGLRIDHDGDADNRLSPRAALIWDVSPTTAIKALYGRAYREPNVFESAYDDGVTLIANPDLHGERIDTLELVADQRVGTTLTLRASVYSWRMDGLIALGLDAATQIPQYQSGGSVHSQGLELSADKTWDGGYRLRSNLSLSDTYYARTSAELINSPRLIGNVALSAPLPMPAQLAWLGAGLRGNVQLHYDGSRLTNDGSRAGGYARSDLIVSKERVVAGLDLLIGVHNLFDKTYWHPGATTNWQNAFEQDGRSYRAQLTYGFGR
ncbi:MAG: TonB-dependent receptor [Pseudomonadota bacterium]